MCDNAKSIEKIKDNVFDAYEKNYAEILKQNKNKLILISLAGYQVIELDLGHVDFEYIWHTGKTDDKGKYKKQIIARITIDNRNIIN
ncbi:hypothetical protein PIROE2DRAFT_9676 [Piromyces sp. E2]|nr:hypothetical protein PIROE2DRAFT_9676 [Piromyces sp. E2]|eukprot:OUM63737.1 hypothetical protein PIROE2DRAFT_9676 [Piromyces sp. E2]